jgi:hypothetical protein
MAEAFFGYLLPWGQMSYWGAQVIVNLFGAIPVIGPDLSLWIRGDYVVSDATLNRFFAFHVIAIPLVLLGLVAAHLIALHEVGSNNPDGIEVKENLGPDGHPRRHDPVAPLLHHQGPVRRVGVPADLQRGDVLRAGNGRLLPGVQQLPAGRFAEDPAAHRADLVLHAVLLGAARHHLRLHVGADGRRRRLRRVHLAASRLSFKTKVIITVIALVPDHRHAAAGPGREVLGRGAVRLVGGDPGPAAVAGPLAGEVDPLPSGLAQVCVHRVRHLPS